MGKLLEVKMAAKPQTTVQEGVSIFVSMNALDILIESLDTLVVLLLGCTI